MTKKNCGETRQPIQALSPVHGAVHGTLHFGEDGSYISAETMSALDLVEYIRDAEVSDYEIEGTQRLLEDVVGGVGLSEEVTELCNSRIREAMGGLCLILLTRAEAALRHGGVHEGRACLDLLSRMVDFRQDFLGEDLDVQQVEMDEDDEG
jgi:hypothetical protein